jgi:hypothetical protein
VRENITEEKDMNLKQIEEEALHLSEEERAELAQKLLLSLDTPSIEEIEEDWLVEAHRRAREPESVAFFESKRPGLVCFVSQNLKGHSHCLGGTT